MAYLLLDSFLGNPAGNEAALKAAAQAKQAEGAAAALAMQRSGLGGRRVPPKRARSAGETVIVVGAGTAGAAVAVGLADRGFKVLLFERVCFWI